MTAPAAGRHRFQDFIRRIAFNLRRTQLVQRLFPLFERAGLHLTEVHFYQPIPDTRTLKNELWSDTSPLVGLDMRDADQAERYSEFNSRFGPNFDRLCASSNSRFRTRNEMFDGLDAFMTYCFVREHKPRRILEAGSGHSTLLLLDAMADVREEDGVQCELTSADPYAPAFLSRGDDRLRLIRRPVQEMPLSTFAELEENDILFIDSSHIVRIGSDVQYLLLEVIPRLAPGVLVHLHDIFLPFEYPEAWVKGRLWFFNEQYMLQSFLSFNDSFEILWASRFMLDRHSHLVEGKDNQLPNSLSSSLWMKRAK